MTQLLPDPEPFDINHIGLADVARKRLFWRELRRMGIISLLTLGAIIFILWLRCH